MKTIKFTKIVASGNDFVVVKNSPQSTVHSPHKLARIICDRKYGVGADGLLVLEKSRVADVKMRIFNADGSEAQMCGNGARCVALYYSHQSPSGRLRSALTSHQKKLKIETRAGIIEAEVSREKVRIRLTEPKGYKAGIPLRINNRALKVDFINTGVPHTIIFVGGIDRIDVNNIGRQVRQHKRFAPAGTNVDFVEVINKDTISVRTYERGVEDETLACGTGSVASALVFALKSGACDKINVHTQGREILGVYFKRQGEKFTPLETTEQTTSSKRSLTGFSDVWLEGKVTIICKGEYNV